MTEQTIQDLQGYTQERERLWQSAVETLTAAVRCTHPECGPLDFADFLTSVLAAVAANVGSTTRLIEGRPQSWEADLVHRLVCGTVGDDAATLWVYRSEPIIVCVNVAQLVCEERQDARQHDRAGVLPGLYEAIDALPDPWAEDSSPSEDELDAFEAAVEALRRAYTRGYATYATRFETAVHAVVAARFPDLRVPVTVRIDTDPESVWWSPDSIHNPLPLDEHDLPWQLWTAAREEAGLPVLDDTY